MAIRELLGKAENGVDHTTQFGALLAQGLGPLRLVPDFGITEFEFDFCQTLLACIEVKDTP